MNKPNRRKPLSCQRCGHKWQPRKTTGRINVCAFCRSPYWNTPKNRMTVFGRPKKKDPLQLVEDLKKQMGF